MSQYISFYLDCEKRYYKNKGLRSVIEYIGRHEHRMGYLLSDAEAYKHGKKVIDSSLHKSYKNTINRLVYSCKVKITDDCTDNRVRPKWKIHKRKAVEVFEKIFSILKKYNNPDVCAYFATLCIQLGFNCGAEMVGSPYYKKFSDKDWLRMLEFDQDEVKILTDIAAEIEAYSVFY